MEDKALYWPILKKAWQLTIKFKSLWFLGLFAAILSSGGEFELLSRIIFSPGNSSWEEIFNNFQRGISDNLPAGEKFLSNAWLALTGSPESLISAIIMLVVALTFTVFLGWLAVTSQVGLINNINLLSRGRQATINDGIDAGVTKFWPVLTVNAIYKLILLIIFSLLSRQLLAFGLDGFGAGVGYLVLLVLLAIITVIVSFIIRYQLLYIVLGKAKIIPALQSAWRLFTGNWLVSLEMAFILFIAYILAAALTAFATALFLAVPLVFLNYANQIPALAILSIGVLSISAIFIVTFLITAIFSAFNWAAWTMLFNQISKKGAVSHIMKLSGQRPGTR